MSKKLRMPCSPQYVLTDESKCVISCSLHQLRNVQQNGVWGGTLKYSNSILRCKRVGWVLLGEIRHGLDRSNRRPTQQVRQLWDIVLDVLFSDKILSKEKKEI